jgi:hypothetical protein
MFNRIRQRLRDVRAIKSLCEGAEQQARAAGKKEPGAEHFVLAALELPDGTAWRAFERLQADPLAYRSAIDRQYADALHAAGIAFEPISGTGDDALPRQPEAGLYRAQASGQTLLQELARRRRVAPEGPLLGAHVLLSVIAIGRHGVAARALQTMDIDPALLTQAARAEIEAAGAHA